MDITINVKPRKMEEGTFNYGNMQSRYGVNTQYFTKDGMPYTIVAGELHFSRVPRTRWKSTLLKMRDCGINTVSTYVFWNYHNPQRNVFDFSGDKNVAAFLWLCREIKMPCILRIGPWCHGEVIRGGFPLYVDLMPFKRTNAAPYLHAVRRYWTRLYEQINTFFDGETVIGLQLENEYTGSTEHIRTLRKIAEEIGFKVPFFTMTAWPSGVPDRDFLPTLGGYPDAPWAREKKPLRPNHRFAISPAKTQEEIGADLHKNRTAEKNRYDLVPQAFCETGPGVQVTQHRRPFISEKDGYGVGFAKFASGANWLGYYMFCGGRNPGGKCMQENRRTGYPNNYPVIDYDFQAPISRYGECRPHGDRLRLMHLFIRDFDPEICTKQPFFPAWKSNDPMDISFLKCSVRVDEHGSGYFFASSYEKGLAYNGFRGVHVQLNFPNTSMVLPEIDIPAGSMFFYPFQVELHGILFDYILAQPIAKLGDGVYFMECPGIPPRCKTQGKEHLLKHGRQGNVIEAGGKQVNLILLTEQEAKQFHSIHGKAVFAKGTVFSDDQYIYYETKEDGLPQRKGAKTDVFGSIALVPCRRKKLPYNSYLYSTGRRRDYELRVPPDILKGRLDVELKFAFEGLNLQVFSGKKLINDFFNIDGTFLMRLRDYEEFLQGAAVFTIRTVPKTKYGISNVYNEIPLPLHSNKLELSSVREIVLTKQAVKS